MDDIQFKLRNISLPAEKWAGIEDGRYAISDHGRVVSFSFKGISRILVMTAICGIYLRIPIYRKGEKHIESIHRLVAKAFIPNPDNLPEVNHKDGDKWNNHIDNLEWCTKSQNKRHSIDVLHRPHPMLGKKYEDSYTHIEVEQYSKDGKYIATYHSIRVAGMRTGIEESNISRAASGKRKSAGGFIWKIKK